MSSINNNRVSRYYRMTPQIMLEYNTKQYDMVSNALGSTDKQPETYYTYVADDGSICYTENIRYSESADNYTNNQGLFLKLPDTSRSGYVYKGDSSDMESKLTIGSDIQYKTTINQAVKNDILSEYGAETRFNFYYDSINLYLLRGFNLDTLAGVSIRVKAKAKAYEIKKDALGINRTYINESYVTLLDYYLDKEIYGRGVETSTGSNKSIVHYLNTPIYMNSKYYDKYITVEFPSPYAISRFNHIAQNTLEEDSFVIFLQDDDMLRAYEVSDNAQFIIEFSTVSENSIQMDGSFILDKPVEASLNLENPADYLNAKIYEDSESQSIIYYPTYGTANDSKDLDMNIMAKIENGQIPIVANAFYTTELDFNLNDVDLGTMDQLYYYTDSDDYYNSKWKVYNDVYVQYYYRYNNELSTQYKEKSEVVKHTESFSRLIDYSNGQNGDEFWRSRYVPYIKNIIGMTCTHITIKYTCRLVNVYRGIECIRVATLTVDAQKYNKDISKYVNLNTYKIVNKLQNQQVQFKNDEPIIKEKYIRTYYDTTNLIAKNMGEATEYPQGQMTLRLKHTNSVYRINLFNITNDNIRVPYDLTGPYKYKIVFPNVNGGKISIRPNVDTADQNMGVGTLAFFITGEQAKQIMSVPATDRYFAVMTDVKNAVQETTLYEGKVEWI